MKEREHLFACTSIVNRFILPFDPFVLKVFFNINFLFDIVCSISPEATMGEGVHVPCKVCLNVRFLSCKILQDIVQNKEMFKTAAARLQVKQNDFEFLVPEECIVQT